MGLGCTQREPISSPVRETHLYFTPLNPAFASVQHSPVCWSQNSVLFPPTVGWKGIRAWEADPGSTFVLPRWMERVGNRHGRGEQSVSGVPAWNHFQISNQTAIHDNFPVDNLSDSAYLFVNWL